MDSMESALQDLLQGTPGIDSRMWVSYGTVELDENLEGGQAVQFDEELGPLVEVRLHPRNDTVTCRLGMLVSGALEGSYVPLVGGDEVLVVIPEGDTSAMPVIVARLANALDEFPTKVAGQPTTNNNLGFARIKAPVFIETGSSFMLRSAITGAFIGIDEKGKVTIRDGKSTAMQFTEEGFVIQDKDGTGQFVLNHKKGNVGLWWDDSLIQVEKQAVSVLSGGNVMLAGAGKMVSGHAVTIEQVVNLLVGYLTALSGAIALLPSPLTSAALAPLFSPVTGGLGILNAGIAMAGLGSSPGYQAFMPAMAASAKVLPTSVDPAPGLACPGVLLG